MLRQFRLNTKVLSLTSYVPSSLFVVFHHLLGEEIQLHAGLAEHLLGFGTGVVFVGTDHTDDAAVDDKHGAGAAGSHAAVERGAVEGDAQLGGLAYGVLLGVDCAYTVLGDGAVLMNGLLELMTDLIAVRKPFGSTHIAGDQNLAVTDHHAATAPTVACGALAHRVGDFHEILVPRGTHVFGFLHIAVV